MSQLDYSILIPVYSGEKTVEKLNNQIIDFFSTTEFSYEVIFIHDCGFDKSWIELEKIYNSDENHHVKLIKLSRNFGQHNALICGIENAKGNFIVTLDEDLQHSPYDIAKLIQAQKNGDFDVVYGKYEEQKHSKFRNITSSLLKKLIALAIPDIHKDYSAFRLMKSDIGKSLIEMRNSYTFLDGYISWITTNCTSVTVKHFSRQGGESSYDLKMLLEHSINIFITFSNFPLRLVSYSSIIIFIVTTLYSFYVIYRKLVYDDLLMGYPSLIISIGFGVGFIMISLGIIGEYIYRINLKTTKKPNYKVIKILSKYNICKS